MIKISWIKISTDIFYNRKINLILKEKEGDTYFKIWIRLLIIASESNQGGALTINESLPFTIKEFSKILGKKESKTNEILQKFLDLEMLVLYENIYYIKNWELYQSADKLSKIKESNRLRQQKFRTKRKVESNVTVTPNNTLDKDKEKIKERENDNNENNSGFRGS